MSCPIFILGCDRSGTCWLGNILQNHPQIQTTIEHPDVFPMVTDLALNPQRNNELYPKIVKFYQEQLEHTAVKYYADKSHPNMWIAKQLSKTFGNALFVGIQREPFGTISSMKKHYSLGVSWHDEWTRYPIPNRFLGIKIINCYKNLTLVERCILQLKAYNQQMEKIHKILGDKLFLISYENLINHNGMILNALSDFLGLSSPLICKEIKKESLYKWRTNLNQNEINKIRSEFYEVY